MEQLNGKPLGDYGLVLEGYEGILDMPSRLGDTFYDWGDLMQPLLSEEDIFWQARDFSLKAIYDPRFTEKKFNQVIGELSDLPQFMLESKYGDFKVKIKQIFNIRDYDKLTRLTILLNERQPEFNGVLPVPLCGNGIRIDGYELRNDFGIVVSRVKGLIRLPALKLLHTTVFNSPPVLSGYRDFGEVELDCVKFYGDVSKLKNDMDQFKKLLSQSGYRSLTYGVGNYLCFLTEGFRVIFSRHHLIKFKVKLKLAPPVP